VFGGTVKADAQVSLLPEGQFSVAAELTNADVAEIAREFTTRHQVTGRAFARLQLAGSTQGAHTLEGLGDVRLRGANIYRLPAVISLLDELRVRETGPGVFTSSDVDFRIQGDIIYFDRFDLHGESLTLKGYRGEMGLDRHLNLDFYTIVGGEKRWVPFMRPLVGEASRQFLRIHITGTPDDLRMRREVLPALNETLQQLFPELARPSAAGGDPPPPRPFLSSRRLGLQRR
jgi:hypothetical protein